MRLNSKQLHTTQVCGAGKHPNSLGLEQTHLTVDDKNDAEYLPKNYEDAIFRPNGAKRLAAMKLNSNP